MPPTCPLTHANHPPTPVQLSSAHPISPQPCRSGVVVTLFLAMAAVQFVITEHQPASSYIMPTQVRALLPAAYVSGALDPARVPHSCRCHCRCGAATSSPPPACTQPLCCCLPRRPLLPQQLAITTYVLLALIADESILVRVALGVS